MKVFLSLEPKKRTNLLSLFAAGLFFWTSITLLLPVLPTYIENVGGTTQQVGLVMGSFAIGLLFSRSWLGNLADHHSRKIVVLIGTIVVAVAPLGYLWAKSIPLLIATRAFHGISIAAFTTGYSALVVDLSPLKQRGELIGYMSLAVPIGMAIGPALGGFLEAEVGYETLFLVCATTGFIAFLLANQVQEIQVEAEISDNFGHKLANGRSFWQLLKAPSLQIPALILLLIGAVFGTLVTFLPLFIRSSGINLNAGLFYSAAAIASFIIRVICGKASDLIGRGVFITGSLACYALSMLLLSVVHSPPLFLVAATLEGMGAGLLIPMMIALMSDRSLANERGRVYALCIGGFDVGVAIAGPILGSLATILNYREMFAVAAIMALLSLGVFLTQSSKNLNHSLRFALGQETDAYALNQ